MSEISNAEKRKGMVLAGISLIIAILSPVGMTLILNASGVFAAHLIGVFGIIFIGAPLPIDGGGGMIPPTVNYTAGLLVLPLIALRLLFVFQIFRTYNNQTTKGTAIVFGIISELYMVILNLPSYASLLSTPSIGELYVPIPILLLVGALLLWKFPPFVPSKPWDSSKEFGVAN